jgi:hypothetical protein
MENLQDLMASTVQHRFTNSVLLLELQENESDPNSFLPTMIYLSSRDARSNTKTLHKMGCTSYYLMSPPSKEQLLLMKKQHKHYLKTNKELENFKVLKKLAHDSVNLLSI